jgi:hypothetical protein
MSFARSSSSVITLSQPYRTPQRKDVDVSQIGRAMRQITPRRHSDPLVSDNCFSARGQGEEKGGNIPKSAAGSSQSDGSAKEADQPDSGYGSLEDSSQGSTESEANDESGPKKDEQNERCDTAGSSQLSQPNYGESTASLARSATSLTVPQPAKNLFSAKRRPLHEYFNLSIGHEFRCRFDDLKELFEKPFFKALWKGSTPSKLMSWRLLMLVEDELAARPWGVVLCDSSLADKARKFFKQTWVKKHCRPVNGDASQPPIDFIIYERGPRESCGDPSVWRHIETKFPGVSCGNVHFDRLGHRFTLGGLISVTVSEGTFIFGLTCGHTIKPYESLPQVEDEGSDYSKDEDSDESVQDDDSDYILLLKEPSSEVTTTPGLKSNVQEGKTDSGPSHENRKDIISEFQVQFSKLLIPSHTNW